MYKIKYLFRICNGLTFRAACESPGSSSLDARRNKETWFNFNKKKQWWFIQF